MLEAVGAKAMIPVLSVVLFAVVLFLFLRRRPPAPASPALDFAFNAKATSVAEIRRILDKAEADYKGKDPEAFHREMDNFVASLGAQYGGAPIPVLDAVKLLRKLERSVSVNPFLSHQDPSA